MLFESVTAKLGTMRKAQSFSVYPSSTDQIVVQSDKSIGMFDPETGEGVLNIKGCYFHHLHPQLGSKPYTFPRDFITECMRACPSAGGKTVLGGGALIVNHTIEVI